MTGYKMWKSTIILVLDNVLVNDYFAISGGFYKENPGKRILVGIMVIQIKTNKTDRLLQSFDRLSCKKTGND